MNKNIIYKDIEELLKHDLSFNEFCGKSILITGANGQIASYLVYLFMFLNLKKDLGIKVIALVRNLNKAFDRFSDFKDSEYFEIINQDICEPIVYSKQINIIIHAASLASAKALTDEPVTIIKANTIGTINVLDYARDNNVKKVLFLSTREVYGSVDEELIDEDSIGKLNQTEIRSSYPESKRVAENMLICYQYQYGVNYLIARIAHTYGPLMEIYNDGRVMSELIKFTVNKEDIILNSDGSAIRAFCYITDTIDALIRILTGKGNQIYNIANEEEQISIADLAQKLINIRSVNTMKLIKSSANSEFKHGYLKTIRKELSTKKIRELGWKPAVMLDEGLNNTIMYFI